VKLGALIVSVIKNEYEGINRISALKKVGDISAIRRIVLTFKRAGIDDIYIISNQNEVLKKEISKVGVTFIPAESGSEDMFFYVKKGLQYLEGKTDFLFIMPSSVPLFTAATVKKLAGMKCDVSMPVNNGVSGHPILIRSDVVHEILPYNGGQGLSGAIKSLGRNVKKIEVEDSGILIYETDARDFSSALKNHSLNKFHPELRIQIGREKIFMGPGVEQLLKLIDETGSIRLACEFMGISYSKGRTIIDTMENQLGYSVLERRQGGEYGGSSVLTPEGKDIMKRYSDYEKSIKKYAEDIFADYFG